MENRYTVFYNNTFFTNSNPSPVIYKFLWTIISDIQVIKNYDPSTVIDIENITKNKYIKHEKIWYSDVLSVDNITFDKLMLFVKDVKKDIKDIESVNKYYHDILSECGLEKRLPKEEIPEDGDNIRKIYDCDKKVYFSFKEKIKSGSMDKDSITELFIQKYDILELLDEQGLLDKEEGYHQYAAAINDMKKEDEYYKNKDLYFSFKEKIKNGTRTLNSISKEFSELYVTFSHMEENGLFDKDDEYDIFCDIMEN